MSEHEPLLIDPRKVERYERYLLAYAHQHAVDPLEHKRRELAGWRFLAALRRRKSRFDPPAAAAPETRAAPAVLRFINRR